MSPCRPPEGRRRYASPRPPLTTSPSSSRSSISPSALRPPRFEAAAREEDQEEEVVGSRRSLSWSGATLSSRGWQTLKTSEAPEVPGGRELCRELYDVMMVHWVQFELQKPVQ